MEAFEKKLQLKQEYKDIIKALVSKHDAGNNDNDGKKKVTDIVEGKGKGLVILLHGPPGVGKTLTAETIAEATGKPLFIVSVAEIGLDAAKAEKNLQQMFDLASAWGAILLVDEADVFLEARSSESGTERNALVSVLLRVLEYYHGIMILTTNRIRHLDVAVQSRIHLAVRYNELEKEQKAEIFKYYLNQLEKENIYQRDRIDEWVDEYGSDSELNGRQIRNLVSAALALARNETGDDRVTDKHLKKVLKVVNDFIKDLAPTVRSQRDANEVGRQGRG
jgi:SpoVK/Ycf46/Vps4 family AAA+-type ATPase